MSKTGAYRLFKQASGRTYFAEVEVEVEVTSEPESGVGVVFDDGDQTTLPAESLAAAERGCREAVAAVAALDSGGGSSTMSRVRVKHLTTNWVDTTPDTVYAASYLAVVTAAGATSHFELYHLNEWRVKHHT